MSRNEQLEAFLATRGATKCAPSKGSARSLKALRREHEDRCTHGPRLSAEQRSEQEREAFGRARLGGASVSEALDEAQAV